MGISDVPTFQYRNVRSAILDQRRTTTPPTPPGLQPGGRHLGTWKAGTTRCSWDGWKTCACPRSRARWKTNDMLTLQQRQTAGLAYVFKTLKSGRWTGRTGNQHPEKARTELQRISPYLAACKCCGLNLRAPHHGGDRLVREMDKNGPSPKRISFPSSPKPSRAPVPPSPIWTASGHAAGPVRRIWNAVNQVLSPEQPPPPHRILTDAYAGFLSQGSPDACSLPPLCNSRGRAPLTGRCAGQVAGSGAHHHPGHRRILARRQDLRRIALAVGQDIGRGEESRTRSEWLSMAPLKSSNIAAECARGSNFRPLHHKPERVPGGGRPHGGGPKPCAPGQNPRPPPPRDAPCLTSISRASQRSRLAGGGEAP